VKEFPAYIRKGTFGAHGRCYAGLGASGGVSFGNEMVLITGRYFEPGAHPSEQVDKNPVMEKYAAKTLAYTRLFVSFGVHYGVADKISSKKRACLRLVLRSVYDRDLNFLVSARFN
jgi:hypothetical protein